MCNINPAGFSMDNVMGVDKLEMENCSRGEVLKKALKIINGERQNTYGDPEDSFQLIAAYWSTYVNARFAKLRNAGKPERLNGKDIALMMTLFKIAREHFQGKVDNLIDGSGYLGIAGDYPQEKD